MVGLIPLFAVGNVRAGGSGAPAGFPQAHAMVPGHNPDFARPRGHEPVDAEQGARLLLTIANRSKLERIYRYVFDENEFLSPHGIRALSKFHKDHPFALNVDGRHRVDYEPAESTTDLFGGNSNWRGPVWFPLNFLMIESLQRVHYYYGDEFKVECPTRSGQQKTLWEAARDISQRLSGIFLQEERAARRCTATWIYFRTIRTGAI